jgi:hypothetical protein
METPKEIHYLDFMAAVEMLPTIPGDDLKAILAKPPSDDSTADSRWRRLCSRHNITTKSQGLKTSDTKAYMQAYSLRQKLNEAESRIASLESLLNASNKTADVAKVHLARVDGSDRHLQDRAVLVWIMDSLCGKCLDQISDALTNSEGRGPLCVRCNETLRRMVRLVSTARKGKKLVSFKPESKNHFIDDNES